MPLLLEALPAARFATLPRAQTVFFFPVGPLEDHGPHLPMALDLFESERLCELAAARLERELPGWFGVVMPRAPLGVDSDTTGTRIVVRGHVLRDWLVDSALSLSRMGFGQFVVFSGQLGPRQLTAIEEAGKALRRRGGPAWIRKLLKKGPPPVLVSASSALTTLADMRRSPFAPDPAEHGGARDTSVGLYSARDFVDPCFAGLPEIPRSEPRSRRMSLRRKGALSGYWGNPSRASTLEGGRILEESLNEIWPKLRALWAGARPESLFRSWYSLLWPNRSFFRAWLLFYACVILLGSWFYLSVTSMVQQ
jgi:creatinine amidohydrolase